MDEIYEDSEDCELEKRISDDTIVPPRKKVKTDRINISPLDLISGPLSFQFLNREKDSVELAKAMCEQKLEPKGVLPILSQHFGSGKTTLVENFRKVLESDTLEFPQFGTLKEAVLVKIDLSYVSSEIDASSIVSSMDFGGELYNEFFPYLLDALQKDH